MDFAELARQPDDRLDLLTGALLIAKDAYPALDLVREARRLDELAEPIRHLALDRLPARDQARAISDHLYLSSGFRGNEAEYYDPKNSFINDVLERKKGIPISLAVVYVEVARRVGVRAHGISFPGHFLVRVEGAGGAPAAIVDPFFRGSVLGARELAELGERATGKTPLDARTLEAAPNRMILFRMLANLRGIHASRGDFRALLLVLDRMLDLAPNAASELRDRGLLSAKLGAPRAAIDDLTRYVLAAPNAGDVAEVRRILAELERSPPSAAN